MILIKKKWWLNEDDDEKGVTITSVNEMRGRQSERERERWRCKWIESKMKVEDGGWWGKQC